MKTKLIHSIIFNLNKITLQNFCNNMQENSSGLSTLSKEQIFEKIKFYCKYRERCVKEVRTKLLSYKLQKADTERILDDLINENYINDERFATAFVRGKFSLNHWGKLKIKIALKQLEINDHIIKNALNVINEEEYKRIINKLAEKKFYQLRAEKNLLTKKIKIQNFLLQKGFERNLISDVIKKF